MKHFYQPMCACSACGPMTDRMIELLRAYFPKDWMSVRETLR